jgi:hypothetical protein
MTSIKKGKITERETIFGKEPGIGTFAKADGQPVRVKTEGV